MNEAERQSFENHLKRSGKKPHVIEGLVRQVSQFEQFLQTRNKGLDTAIEQDILDFAAELEADRPGSSGKRVRGLALYFRWNGNAALAETASGVREGAIARKRNIFKLSDFRGVDPEYIARLKSAGINNIEDMLTTGKTTLARQELADRTGVPMNIILELVMFSDLARLNGVKAIRARLYYDAGVDSVEKLAGFEPEELLRLTAEFVERTGFDGIAPLPKEVLHTIEAARKLPKLVQYD